MSIRTSLFVTLLCFSTSLTFAQRNYDQYNHLGVLGGINFSSLNSDQLISEDGTGFFAGFTTRGSVYNNFDLIYGINFVRSEYGIMGRDVSGNANNGLAQRIDYALSSVQINFLGSYNLIRNHLSIEAGPVLNVNGNLKLQRDGFEDYILDGFETLKAADIVDINPVNFFVMAGLTAGIRNFRAGLQYQYGVTNLLSKVNDTQGIDQSQGKIKANPTNLALLLFFYF